MNSIKSLLPSLLLIGVYFIAEEFFGPVTGACIAFVLGMAEFIYTRISEKIYDKLILFMTLFFCLPGLLSLCPAAEGLALLQPLFTESALALLTGIFAFSTTDLTKTMPAAYRKNIQLTAIQQQSMRKMLSILFYLICLHLLLAVWAIYDLPEKTSRFITGSLLYIWLGSFFLILFLRNRIRLMKMRKEEWLPIVNEKGEVTGKAPRSICHSGAMLLHPVVHLHIVNERNEIFLQKRSMKKDLLPGLWDTAVGGHIGLNEEVEQALKREASEELGITNFEARFIGHYIWESPREKEMVFSFLCTRYDHIRIANDEVDAGRFWTRKEIEQGIRTGQVTPNFAHEYKNRLGKMIDDR